MGIEAPFGWRTPAKIEFIPANAKINPGDDVLSVSPDLPLNLLVGKVSDAISQPTASLWQAKLKTDYDPNQLKRFLLLLIMKELIKILVWIFLIILVFILQTSHFLSLGKINPNLILLIILGSVVSGKNTGILGLGFYDYFIIGCLSALLVKGGFGFGKLGIFSPIF